MTIEVVETRYGAMHLPSTDRGQYWWFKNTEASPEDEVICLVCDLLRERPRGTAVDVGANFGAWTLPLSKVAHAVVAIEPQNACSKLLRASLDENKIRNVRVHLCAAGEKPDVVAVPELDLDLGTNFGGISLAIPHSEQPDAPFSTVPVIRLDDLLQGEQVSFIKIDVEGYEERVLKGLVDTIARCRPILFVETDHPRSDAAKLEAMIEAGGYSILRRGGNALGMPL